MTDAARARLERIFRRALAAVDARAAVRRALSIASPGGELVIAGCPIAASSRLVVLAAGKAAIGMAQAVEEIAGDRIVAGIAVTKDGHSGALARIPVRETGHPVPDARCESAARELLAHAAGARAEDVLLVLLSGGASALLACPLPGLTLAEVAATTTELLRSGADIRELNTVRKHMVDVAGGRLALASGAGRIEVLLVSDVLGDPLDVIASGPCAPDASRYADALAVLARRGLRERVPAVVIAHLEAGARGERGESAKPGDPIFSCVRSTIVARLDDALEAAAGAARDEGLRPVRVGVPLAGEARDVGRELAARALALHEGGPICLLAGGETTVTVRGGGRGGRSQELALAAALAWSGEPGVALLAAGTDGSDGPTDAAGAFADGGTVVRGSKRGADAARMLAENDAYGFFDREGGLIRTGPTGTNVMDLALVEVDRP